MPLQTESLARWPDGSVRWLLLDFQIDLAAKQKKTLTLRYGPEIRRAPCRTRCESRSRRTARS